MTTVKNTYGWFDLAKLFFAFCVIFLHTGAFLEHSVGRLVHGIVFAHCNVFFFSAAGYFLGLKNKTASLHQRISRRTHIFLNYIKKILFPYFFWSLFYSFFLLYRADALNIHNIMNGLWGTLTLKSATVIWFLGVLIVSIIIIMHIHHNPRWVVIILGVSLVLVWIGSTFTTYYFLFENGALAPIMQWLKFTFVDQNHVWFSGLFYTLCGFVMGAYTLPNWINQLKSGCLLFVVSLATTVGEAVFVANQTTGLLSGNGFSQPILVFSFFLILSNLPPLKFKTIFLRKLSVYMYYSHMAVIFIYSDISSIADIAIPGIREYWTPIFATVVLCSLFYFCFNLRASKYKKRV